MQYHDVKKQKDNKEIKDPPTVGKRILIVGLLVGIPALGLLLFNTFLAKNLNPISIVSTVSAANLKENDGRTNVLILGSDKRTAAGAVTSELTDTILVASIGRVDKDVVLISLPRDMWVQSPQGYHSKINEIYTYGKTDELKKVVEEILGIPIHYHALVTFDLFKDAIDILGGIEVTVDRSFTDRAYPIEGKENAPENERYEVVHFEAGAQKMLGDTALKFARSRKGDNDEGTDFARARRQQKVIMAIKDKALSLQTLVNPGKLKELYELYSKNIDTNIDLGTVQNFYLLSQQISFDKVESIVLDDRSEANEGGLLYAPEDKSLYGGRYVLIPRTGDYSQIHAFVQKYIFGSK